MVMVALDLKEYISHSGISSGQVLTYGNPNRHDVLKTESFTDCEDQEICFCGSARSLGTEPGCVTTYFIFHGTASLIYLPCTFRN